MKDLNEVNSLSMRDSLTEKRHSPPAFVALSALFQAKGRANPELHGSTLPRCGAFHRQISQRAARKPGTTCNVLMLIHGFLIVKFRQTPEKTGACPRYDCSRSEFAVKPEVLRTLRSLVEWMEQVLDPHRQLQEKGFLSQFRIRCRFLRSAVLRIRLRPETIQLGVASAA